MRIIIVHGMSRFAGKQPRVIDITPPVASVNRLRWHRTRAALLILLAVLMLPILWMIAGVAAVALLGLGAIAAVAFRLRLWHQRALPAGDQRTPWKL